MKNSKVKSVIGMAMMGIFFIAMMPSNVFAQSRANSKQQYRQSNRSVTKKNNYATKRSYNSGRSNNYSVRGNQYSPRRNYYSSSGNYSSRRAYYGYSIGNRYSSIHRKARRVNYNNHSYWFYNGTYYHHDRYGYIVVAPPAGIYIGY